MSDEYLYIICGSCFELLQSEQAATTHWLLVHNEEDQDDDKNIADGKVNMEFYFMRTGNQVSHTSAELTPSPEETNILDGFESRIRTGLEHNILTTKDKVSLETDVSGGTYTSEAAVEQMTEENSGSPGYHNVGSLAVPGERNQLVLAENNNVAGLMREIRNTEEQQELAITPPGGIQTKNEDDNGDDDCDDDAISFAMSDCTFSSFDSFTSGDEGFITDYISTDSDNDLA